MGITKPEHSPRLAGEPQASWLARLSVLVDQVETWAKALGWDTKRLDRKMKDSEIGVYLAPALLMQKEFTRVLLEPITRSAPGADGLVDLYLLPAYDDIASLYYYSDKWMIHYPFPDDPLVSVVEEIEPRPFDRQALDAVLSEMARNAS